MEGFCKLLLAGGGNAFMTKERLEVWLGLEASILGRFAVFRCP